MPRLSFLFRTDTHVADKGPASWKGDYPGEIWSNLEQVGVLARNHEVNAVLDGGDFFNLKSPTRNTHALVAKAAKVHLAYPCPTFIIPGNHDISYNNLETLERQPLGVLFETGVFKPLYEQVFQDGTLRVRIVGMPYSPIRTLDELRAIRKKPGDSFLVVLIHALAGEAPPAHVEDFFGEPVFRYQDLISPDGPDVFCFGHWHRDQGIVSLSGSTFVNQGALSRGALVKENLERIPKVALMEFFPDGPKFTPIHMNVLPASEVFDLERKERQEQEREDINQFIGELISNSNFNAEESIETNIRTIDFAHDVRDLALVYLGRARGEAQGEI